MGVSTDMTERGLAGLRVMHIMKFDRHLQIAPLAKAVIIYTSPNCVTFIIRKKYESFAT